MPGDEPWKPYPEQPFFGAHRDGYPIKGWGRGEIYGFSLSSLLGKVQQWRAEGVFMGGKG